VRRVVATGLFMKGAEMFIIWCLTPPVLPLS